MSERVREILGWYGSDNPGTLTNLARILNHGRLAGTGRMVILPVDQGFEHGPARSFAINPAAYDPRYHFQLAIEAGCSAYAAPLGFLEAGARVRGRGAADPEGQRSQRAAGRGRSDTGAHWQHRGCAAPGLCRHWLHDLPGLDAAPGDVSADSRLRRGGQAARAGGDHLE